MRNHRFRKITGAIVALLVVGVGLWWTYQWWAQPSKPSAFYTPPADLTGRAPGSLLRSEPIAAPAAGQRAWRVLYASTDPRGAPVAVSGLVVAPAASAPAGGWPVIAWAHGTTGVAPRCAPSLEAAGGAARVPELDALVAAGTVITITDYPGLGTPAPHPYLVGASEGRAVLDSVRAAHSLLGRDTNATTAIFGHSQGGHAAVFADALAPTYAPDLHVVGVAAMAPPTNLADLLVRDEREPAGIVLTALAVTSWSAYYPDAPASAIVDPVAHAIVERVGRRCIATTDQGITDLPDVALLHAHFLSHNPTTTPGWREHFAENSPTTVTRTIPLLVAQGLTDTLVRPAVTTAFVHSQCAHGAAIEYQTYEKTGHFAVRTAAAAPVRDWLLARVHHEAAPAACTEHTVSR